MNRKVSDYSGSVTELSLRYFQTHYDAWVTLAFSPTHSSCEGGCIASLSWDSSG